MCDNCECEPEWNDEGTAFLAGCNLKECIHTGSEKEGSVCDECNNKCRCSCHTDYTPDGMTLAKGD